MSLKESSKIKFLGIGPKSFGNVRGKNIIYPYAFTKIKKFHNILENLDRFKFKFEVVYFIFNVYG